MKSTLYWIECLTNLHVGSGEANFSVVDKEVEKDLTGLPIIHASGIKGALRDEYARTHDADAVRSVFGDVGDGSADSGGTFRFLDAHMLFRPMRAAGGKSASVKTTIVDAIRDYVETASAFYCGVFQMPAADDLFPDPDLRYLCTDASVRVDGEKTGAVDGRFREILGDPTYALAKEIDDCELPVIARNNLGENRNLWYEEYVPHGSCFWFIVLTPDGCAAEDVIPDGKILQIGGNASVGYGYCRFTKKGAGGF